MTRWVVYHSADWVGLVETGWVTVSVTPCLTWGGRPSETDGIPGPFALMATGRGWTS
jgi:hypothetical protein